jgi:predicted unusual protein kinase regulating ubiquinone biosynthesis (AarF/ABC1/UbiB family)
MNRPLKDISFGQFLVRLFTVARQFDMEVQPQLILLEKTLLNIEGLGRELYPDLDLWETAQPILEEWMRERVSGRVLVERLREQLPEVSESLQAFPQVAARSPAARRGGPPAGRGEACRGSSRCARSCAPAGGSAGAAAPAARC